MDLDLARFLVDRYLGDLGDIARKTLMDRNTAEDAFRGGFAPTGFLGREF